MIMLVVLLTIVGLVLLGLLAVLWSRISGQGRVIELLLRAQSSALERIQSLEREVRRAREEVSAQPSSTPVPSPRPERGPVQTVGPAPPVPEPLQQPAPRPLTDALRLPARPTRSRAEWEALIGGKLLNRIGALALIIGVGFFLKYAFDNDWISETTRVLIGAVSGVLLLLGARRSHSRGYGIFAQGLVGAGIAVLYLSVYASFNFYLLLPEVAAFLLMTAVTITAFQQALRYDSLATALLGWAGGFLTPYLLAGGEPAQPGLFTYLALLTAGVLAIAASRESWAVLHPLTLAATYLSYFNWFGEYYSGTSPVQTGFFLTVFWALFLTLETVQHKTGRKPLKGFAEALAALNALLFLVGMYRLVNPDYHEWMGPVTLLISGVYTGLFLWRHTGGALPVSDVRVLLTAVAFLVIGTEIQFERFATVISWAVEAAALLWLGVRFAVRPLAWSGAVLLVLAFLRLLPVGGALAAVDLDAFVVVTNERALTFLILIAATAGGALLLMKSGGKRELRFGAFLQYLWCFLLLVLVSVEINDAFRQRMIGATDTQWDGLSFMRFMTFALAWMVISLGLMFYGRLKPRVPVVHSALFALALSFVMGGFRGIVFDPPQEFHLLINGRALVLLLLIAGAALHLILLRRQPLAGMEDLRGVIGTGLVLLTLTLVTGETRDHFRKEMVLVGEYTLGEGKEDLLDQLENQKQLSLSAVWLLSSIGIMALGLWRRNRSLRVISIAVFGFTILKIFIYDLSFLETLYRIFSFIGLGLILLGVSYLYQRYKNVIMQ